MSYTAKLLLLGSGELGREFTISAKRLGAEVIACDAYDNAPAMQLADAREVFSMLDGEALRAAVIKHQPDFIVPEVEAIRTEVLGELEAEGFNVVPSARAAQLTMNRDAIRDLAAGELGLTTSTYRYSENFEQVRAAAQITGFPCVIKPVMSSSGKGQSKVDSAGALEAAWDYAVANMRGDRARVIVEQFVDFDYEITQLTVRHKDGISFCAPIGHRQERGDYQESWQPAEMKRDTLLQMRDMAAKVVNELGGYGIFGVEFFVRGDEVIFSELSPRPHDTGMVTMASQSLSQFDLHARAIMGFPVPSDVKADPAASAVILANRDSSDFAYEGVAEALLSTPDQPEDLDIRLFAKPVTRPYRRMGVALAKGADMYEARSRATKAAGMVRIAYKD